MKTITIDYDEYQRELKEENSKGFHNGSQALIEAKRLISGSVNNSYSLSKNDFFEWLRKYGRDD